MSAYVGACFYASINVYYYIYIFLIFIASTLVASLEQNILSTEPHYKVVISTRNPFY
jgi:hypothetical protein